MPVSKQFEKILGNIAQKRFEMDADLDRVLDAIEKTQAITKERAVLRHVLLQHLSVCRHIKLQ